MSDLFGIPDPPRLVDVITELKRELAMRRRVYPKWAATGQHGLDETIAAWRIQCIEVAIAALEARVFDAGPRMPREPGVGHARAPYYSPPADSAEDRLAHVLSEILNMNAPVGWERYRGAAACLLADEVARDLFANVARTEEGAVGREHDGAREGRRIPSPGSPDPGDQSIAEPADLGEECPRCGELRHACRCQP